MKQQLLDLLDRSDSLVEEVFSDNSLWMHVKIGFDERPYTFNDETAAKGKIEDGIRIVLGEAGKLFQKFDYVNAGNMYRRNRDSYSYFNFISDNSPQAKLFYQGSLEIPSTLKLLIREYAERIEPLHQEYIEVSKLQKDLSEQEAADLWNEI